MSLTRRRYSSTLTDQWIATQQTVLPHTRWQHITFTIPRQARVSHRCDAFSNYGAAPACGLEAADIAMGFPGKISAHGSDVEAMLGEGRFAEISAYCTGDVLLTYLLFLHFAYFSGELSAEAHNRSVRQLIEFLELESEARPFLSEFLTQWQASTRPCPMPVPGASAEDNEQQAPDVHLPSEHVE